MSEAPSPPDALPACATVDRFEDGLAVLLVDGETRVVPRERLPKDAREGDVIDFVRGVVDVEATEAARDRQRAIRPPPKVGSFDLD